MPATPRPARTDERRANGDRGQVLPLLVVLLALALGCIVVLGRVGVAARERAEAQTAADAAALAGVVAGPDAAAEAAAANGATLLRLEVVDGVVIVEVEIGGATASAHASIDVAAPAG